jgi:aminoglycoside phosphotransferase (APT) family kinase protein
MSSPAESDGPWWEGPKATFPSSEALAWAARAIGPGACVRRGRRLTGGLVSSVHQLSVVDRLGKRMQVVLRRFAKPSAGAADSIRREANILKALEKTDPPVPRLLAYDAAGESAGLPALLMTRLPGRIDLDPADPESWLRQMATTLARIHTLDLDTGLRSSSSVEWAGKQPERWALHPELWRQAMVIGSQPEQPYQKRFIHGDYQHFNLLWSHGRLTGIVDWGGDGTGHPDIDVGHCRLNLAVLFSAEWAERFRLIYEAESGREVDPRWDLSELLDYSPDWQRFIPIQVAGRRPIDTAGMTARVEALIESVLKRL